MLGKLSREIIAQNRSNTVSQRGGFTECPSCIGYRHGVASSTINPRNGVLAAVTQLGEVLEVFNLKDSTHVVRIGPHGEPEFKISQGYGIPTGIMGFSDVQVADSAIYAVFHGRSFKEIAQNVQQGVYLPDGGRYIYVFSLTGEPLCRYVLDHYVYGISVDEQKGIILATDVNKDDPIIEYSMK